MTKILSVMLLSAVLLISGLAVYSSVQNQDDLIRQLSSDNMEQRINAFYEVEKSGKAAGNKELINALLNLLDRENQLTEATLRESGGQVGTSAKYGEGYSEYCGYLAGFVMEHADLTDKRTLSILLHSSYHPTSAFAVTLMNQGDAVVPILIELSNSDLAYRRVETVEMLGLLADKYRGKISAPSAELIKQALAQRLNDSDVLVRKFASQYLQKIRN